MPLIQPIIVSPHLRTIQKSDVQNTPFSSLQTPEQSSQNRQSNEIGKKAVEPAAPPSALQLQIKALISEQSKMLTGDAEQDPADRP